ncbi:MAG: hypothetical protein VZR00_09880 [Lachnospiraceae bacterium]|jgi:hypothetical protein|nr:hypothetical protein [Lachnospiraceae bacterium]MEE3462169.1 hypothetical protein [Lachnospiraceae bacterium]
MINYIAITEIVRLCNQEMDIDLTPVTYMKDMYEYEDRICLYSPMSNQGRPGKNIENFSLRIYEDVVTFMNNYNVALLIARHPGGKITMGRFDSIWKIFGDQYKIYDQDQNKYYWEINMFANHIQVKGNQQGLMLGFVDLLDP